jgi:hypothetical protein
MASPFLSASDLASAVARLLGGRRTIRGALAASLRALPLRLRRHSSLMVPRPLGKQLHCLSGVLWVTQEGDSNDVILTVGESYFVERAARMLVSALQDAKFELSPYCSRPDAGQAGLVRRF